MGSHVRVENRRTTGSFEDKQRGFESMLRAFRRACDEVGIKTELKQREYYEKPSEKRRRKKQDRLREIESARSGSKKRK